MEAKEPAVKAVLDDYDRALADEIGRTIDFFITQGSDRAIQGVYICGGASRTEGLKEALEAKLPAPVQILNPVQNIAGSGKKMNAQAIRELSFLGAIAIGLALRTSGDTK